MSTDAELFLTSLPFSGHDMPFYSENGFARLFSESVRGRSGTLFIVSDPDDHESADLYSLAVFEAMRLTGVDPGERYVLDGRNAAAASLLIRHCGVIILAGGHVPTQNRFFRDIGLGRLLEGYGGVILGISA